MQPTGDLQFSPNLRWLETLEFSIAFNSILFIGAPDPQTTKFAVDSGVETKHYTPSRIARMPRGIGARIGVKEILLAFPVERVIASSISGVC